MNDEQTKWLQENFSFRKVEQLPVFGSQRSFYRLFGEVETRVAMVDPDHNQLVQFVDKAKLFHKLNVSVPVVYAVCFSHDIALVEDLGDDSLDKIVAGTDDKVALYKQIIDRLVEWQKLFDSSPDLAVDYDLPKYDFDFAFNESMLYVSRYLEEFTGMTEVQIVVLKPDFVDLAEKASSVRKTLMHRDFQSQNILWQDGEPGFVDFQAAMLGPYTYDLAALLYDNYVDLSAEERESLIDYFYERYSDEKREDFYITALQRTLQAVSAYAYLSQQEGKKQYEKYLPRGLRHLEELALRFGWEDGRGII